MYKVKETAKDPRRVQFDLLPQRLGELDQLMQYCGLRTRKELFDNAMTLFEWAVNEVRAGREIASYRRDRDHVEVVRLPVLDNAAARLRDHRAVRIVTDEQLQNEESLDPQPTHDTSQRKANKSEQPREKLGKPSLTLS